MTTDEIFMKRAMDLALMGKGHVSPNPLVGCVIVFGNEIVGEGWHRKYGEAHAEVNAVNAVADKTILAKSTVYVNLEPCSHFGKTPPCADMLVRNNVSRVVIANVDTFQKVNGEGIRKLRQAGIQVDTGVLEKEGRELNKFFFTYIEKKRPYIILKWAETADHYIARENYESKWISNELSRQIVHKMRTEVDAVLVGTNTARHDNPRLNVRDWSGRNPTRIVIDRALKLDAKLNLFDQSQPTLCYNLVRNEEQNNLVRVRLADENFLNHLLDDLHTRHIQSLMIEGGSQTIQSFIDEDLWDEAVIFRSQNSFGKGISAPLIKGDVIAETMIADDLLTTLQNKKDHA